MKTSMEELFQMAVEGMREWDSEAFACLTDDQLQTVIDEAERISREAMRERDKRKT